MIALPEHGMPAYGQLPCEADPEQWFADANTMEGTRKVRAAIAACTACPALIACREHAKKVRPQFGVWGGKYYTQRRRAHRRTGIDSE